NARADRGVLETVQTVLGKLSETEPGPYPHFVRGLLHQASDGFEDAAVEHRQAFAAELPARAWKPWQNDGRRQLAARACAEAGRENEKKKNSEKAYMFYKLAWDLHPDPPVKVVLVPLAQHAYLTESYKECEEVTNYLLKNVGPAGLEDRAYDVGRYNAYSKDKLGRREEAVRVYLDLGSERVKGRPDLAKIKPPEFEEQVFRPGIR